MRGPARRKVPTLVVLVLLVAPLLVTPRVATGPAVAAGPAQAAVPRATSPSELAAACPDPVPLGGFADVEPTDTHAQAIDCLVAYAITQGVESARYAPARSVTRAQMASFLVRLLRAAGVEAEAPSTGRFGDVEGVHADAIEVLAALGIAQGVAATTFAPAATVTRAQMATFLDRTLRHLDVPLPGADDPDPLPFADVAPEDVHAAAIARLAAAGVVAGRTPTSYDPSAAVTRAQMASFLMRSADLLAQAELTHPPYVEQPVVVAEDTVVLDDAQRAALLEAEVDADAGEATLVFDAPPADIAVGDVLVSAPSAAAPDGLLVRVVALEGAQVLAEPAGLTDALASGSGAVTATLRAGDVAEERYAPAGLRVRSLPGQEALSLAFDDVEVAPDVTATGSLSLELTSTLEVDIARRRLVQPYLVRFAATSTLEQRATLELQAERGASFEHEQLVYAAGFAPLTVMVGPVPVVVTPSLEVWLAAGGEITASLGYVVEQTSSASLGATYQPASGWTPVAGWDAGFDHRLDEVLEARAGVVAGIVPTLALYGVIDVSSPVWVGTELEAGRDRDPVWSLGAWVEADAAIGVTLPLVDGLPSYRRTILARDWILAEAERAYPSDAEGVANAFYAAFLDRDADEARRYTRAQRPDAYDDLLARWTDGSTQPFLEDRVTCGDPDPDPGRELRFCSFTTGVTPSDVMVLDRDGDGRWVVLGVGLGEAYPHIWGASPGDPDIVELCVTGSSPLPVRSRQSAQAAVMAELEPGTCGIAGIREDWLPDTAAWWNIRVDGLVGFVARDRVAPVGGAAGFSDDELLAAVGCPRQPCLVEQTLAYEHPQLGPVTLVFRTADTYEGTLLAVDAELRVVWQLGDLGFSVGELRTDVLGHAFVGHSAGGSGYWMLALVPRRGGFEVTELGTQNYGGIWDSTGDGRLELHVSVGLPEMCHSCPPARFAVHAWDGVSYPLVGEIDAAPWIGP